MRIGLHYSLSSTNNGPGKVVSNLIKGLSKFKNIDILHNEIGDYNGVLQLCPNILHFPNTSLIGPNISTFPVEVPDVWHKYTKFLVPSQWVLDFYKTFELTMNKNIFIWPVGIDTDKFISSEQIPTHDVMIYSKNMSDKLNLVIDKIKKLKLSYKLLEYGKYNESEFIECVNSVKCAILLTKTESQGIAYQEILSMNRPCYVLNKIVWDDFGPSYPASSVPYFDFNCGLIENNLDNFELFYNNLNKFFPRKYILENLSLEKQASKYIEYIKS